MDDLPSKKKDFLNFTPLGQNKEMISAGGVEAEPILKPKETGAETLAETSELESVSEVLQAEEIQLPQPVKTKSDGVVVSNTLPDRVKIELPMTVGKITEKIKKGSGIITNSAFWLIAFCRRALRLTKSRFIYSPKEA
ncbi:hypothetical protein KKF11_02905 [Patescibacteria group bacterium]|nr:hypothetical protein [Patescibacteria group bacterium]